MNELFVWLVKSGLVVNQKTSEKDAGRMWYGAFLGHYAILVIVTGIYASWFIWILVLLGIPLIFINDYYKWLGRNKKEIKNA